MKTSLSSPASGSVSRRRCRSVVQYALVWLGAAVAAQGLVGNEGLLTRQKAREEYLAIEASLRVSRADNAVLRREVLGLREDASVIEGLARRELGLISPGERLFIVTDAVPATRREP